MEWRILAGERKCGVEVVPFLFLGQDRGGSVGEGDVVGLRDGELVAVAWQVEVP